MSWLNDKGEMVSGRSALKGLVGTERRNKRVRPRGMGHQEFRKKWNEMQGNAWDRMVEGVTKRRRAAKDKGSG